MDHRQVVEPVVVAVVVEQQTCQDVHWVVPPWQMYPPHWVLHWELPMLPQKVALPPMDPHTVVVAVAAAAVVVEEVEMEAMQLQGQEAHFQKHQRDH
jgi:hypothetical protein